MAPKNAWISPPHSANPWVSGKALPMGVLDHGLALIFASKQAHSHPLGHFLACWGSGEKCQIGELQKILKKPPPTPFFLLHFWTFQHAWGALPKTLKKKFCDPKGQHWPHPPCTHWSAQYHVRVRKWAILEAKPNTKP